MAAKTAIGSWLNDHYFNWQKNIVKGKASWGQFAEYLGVPRGNLDKWSTGERKPDATSAERLAQKTGDYSIFDILGFERPSLLDVALASLTKDMTEDQKAVLWERVQLVQNERAAGKGIHHPRRVGTTRYLLTGLAVCGKCGRPMYCSNMQGHHERKDGTRKVYRYPYYRCSGRYGGHCGAMNAARKVEQAVLRQLYDDLLTPEAIARAEQRLALREQGGADARESLTQDRRERLSQLEHEVANLVQSARRSPLSEALASALADVEAEASAVRAELDLAERLPAVEQTGPDLRALAADVEGALAFGDFQRARRGVQALVRRVVLGRDTLHIDYRDSLAI